MKKRLIIPGVILLIAALLSVGTYFYRLQQYKDWLAAPGVVTDVTASRSSNHGSRSHRIYYTYVVNGISYAGSELFSGRNSSFEAGDPHKIWFDPENPDVSSFNKPKPGLDPIAPLMIGVFLAIASYRAATEKEKRRSRI